MNTNSHHFKCVCGRTLKSQSGFSMHVKKCEAINSSMTDVIDNIELGGMNEESFMFYNSFRILDELACTKPIVEPGSKILFIGVLSNTSKQDTKKQYLRNGFTSSEITRCHSFLKMALGHLLIDTVENRYYRLMSVKKDSKSPLIISESYSKIYHRDKGTLIRYGLESFDNIIYLINQKLELEDITDRLHDSIKEITMRKLKESLPFFKMHKILNPCDEEVTIRGKILDAYTGLNDD